MIGMMNQDRFPRRREENIFVTGIGGCVGHYLFDVLSIRPGCQLFLLARSPEKIRFSYRDRPNVRLIEDCLENIERHAGLLKKMDAVVHLAAGWGRRSAFRVNVDKTLALFSLLDKNRCRGIIYFSTASILGQDNQLLPEAFQLGTPYIKSKYECYTKFPELDICGGITTLFPTIVLGGDASHPFSHASGELKKVWKYLPIVKYFSLDGSFHFIHARDIALVVDRLLTHGHPEKNLVLGNPAVTVDECIRRLCAVAGKKRRFSIDVTRLAAKVIPFFLEKRLSPWDLYSLKRRHFRHRPVRLDDLGLRSVYDTLEKCIDRR